jgi:DNA-binding NtrC family response regulator
MYERPMSVVHYAVLVVEDDELQRRSVERLLRDQGYVVEGSADGLDALQRVVSSDIAVVIIDVNLPGLGGLDLLKEIKSEKPEVECIVFTGSADAGVASSARASGASDYFAKPIVDMDRFEQVVRRCFEVHHLRQTIGRIDPGAATNGLLIGQSRAVLQLRESVERMASSTAPVLITGESGVGKEVVAEALHEASRRSGDFVRVNCAAFPAALIEAELFGAEVGTYTGQRGARIGLFAHADNGTLFLDEIGEMPIELQPKLLRAIYNRRYRPLGARKERDLNARIIAATNVDLQAAAKVGRFREDLLFRLHVLSIAVPPLRDRRDDIPLLALHFARRCSATEGRPMPQIAPAVMAQLVAYDWPGNVRELSNAVLRAVVMCRGSELAIGDFGLGTTDGPPSASSASPNPFAPYYALPLAEAKARVTEDFMAAYLRNRLAECDGNITSAAVAAGVQRPNFKREMRRYGITTRDE